jgi:hypothetical protein
MNVVGALAVQGSTSAVRRTFESMESRTDNTIADTREKRGHFHYWRLDLYRTSHKRS